MLLLMCPHRKASQDDALSIGPTPSARGFWHMMLLATLVAPAYVRLGVRPATLHSRTAAVVRADALPLEAVPLELQPQPPQEAQEPWTSDNQEQWTSGPVTPLPGEAEAVPTLVRVLHATALGLMLFPPLAALLCLASCATTLVLGSTLGFRVARTPLLGNRWLRWYLVAETAHFLASKLTRWGQASKIKPPRMASAERLSLWRMPHRGLEPG